MRAVRRDIGGNHPSAIRPREFNLAVFSGQCEYRTASKAREVIRADEKQLSVPRETKEDHFFTYGERSSGLDFASRVCRYHRTQMAELVTAERLAAGIGPGATMRSTERLVKTRLSERCTDTTLRKNAGTQRGVRY